uniref:Methyltransferase-like protein 9 n=1 Tax=Vespula pensylvanica TaxID=30213 RepID=A0A834UCF6_VESPE|nr:hypothetical protein H0235_006297 [Vespula pensylvanica]
MKLKEEQIEKKHRWKRRVLDHHRLIYNAKGNQTHDQNSAFLVTGIDRFPSLLGRGSMHVFSSEQFEKLMEASGFKGPWNSLVDLGAGDGATTAHVAHLFDRVYATDISPPMRWALSKRKFTVLDVDKWHEEAGPFDVILCLNLLDRCDRPNSLLRQFRTSLTAGGRLVVALVLPFSPYVEVGERGDHKPSEYLPVKGNGLEGQIAGLVDRVFAPLGLRCLAWSKLPYLCEGDLGQAYYFLDDVVFVLEVVPVSKKKKILRIVDSECRRIRLIEEGSFRTRCTTNTKITLRRCTVKQGLA